MNADRDARAAPAAGATALVTGASALVSGKGKRLYLIKLREEQDTELLRSLRRRTYAPGQEKPGPRFLVFFQVDKILPLIGTGEGAALP